MSSWRFLSLEKPRRHSRFRFRDRLICSLGLALGVLFLLLSWGFLVPVEKMVRQRILGTLPDRVTLSKRAVSMGPLAFGGEIQPDTVAQVKSLPGVRELYRQAHYPDPCQLRASYGGESLVTDLVLEMVDENQVAHEVARGYEFRDPGPGRPIPAVMPRAILDLVNSGIAVNTELPQLTESAVIGHGFDLYLGTSSFRPGPAVRVHCILVGVSDEIGAGGPAIPYEAGLRLSKKQPLIHALTLKLEDPGKVQAVVQQSGKLGLTAPRQELASKVTSVVAVLKILSSLLPLAVLTVTAVALGAILELQVTRERQLIALYRALGATPSQVAQLYLLRAVSVAAISFLMGTLGGWMTGLGLANYLATKIPESITLGETLFAPPPSAHLMAASFCLGLTILASWFPALRAGRADPAQVFREPG